MGFQKEFVENLRAVVRILAERRIFRIMRARSEAIKSEEEPRIHAIVFEQAEYDKKQPMGEDMPELRNGQSEAFV
ncbi:MAG: hypothetical protein QMD13_08560 [Candidatus Bathyarchaeia archaeon]|nr:hypothetical protein [Candidatus Bathyarchaeia archaeon]